MGEDVGLGSRRRGGLLLLEGTLDRSDGRGWEGSGLASVIRDANNVLGGLDKEANEIEADLAADELDEGGVVLSDVNERVWVSKGVGRVETGLEFLCIEAEEVQGVCKFFDRHGRRRHGELCYMTRTESARGSRPDNKRQPGHKHAGGEERRDDAQVRI